MTDKLITEIIDEARKTLAQFTSGDATEVRNIPGLHNSIVFADEVLSQCRDRLRWVPCSERLTDKVQYVLCYFGSEDDRFHEIGFHDGQDWYVSGCGGDAQLASDYSATGVTHWMPLPQPPQQEQQEQES